MNMKACMLVVHNNVMALTLSPGEPGGPRAPESPLGPRFPSSPIGPLSP